MKNVTSAYSVEHEDEERLFEQLSSLLTAALQQEGKERIATLRQLECKTEEVHTTLRKHLAKEEEQLFPLLLKHFTFAEQASISIKSAVALPSPSAVLFGCTYRCCCRNNLLHDYRRPVNCNLSALATLPFTMLTCICRQNW